MKKIKIVSLLCSPNIENGNTKKCMDILYTSLCKLFSEEFVKIDSINIYELNIKSCQGCETCFKKGICPLDKKDDMHKIKKTLLDSDLMVIGTPIYLNNIPGNFKLFLDRLSLWSHLMIMKGKPVILVVTSGNNGISFVCKYLFQIFSFFGMNVIGILQIRNRDSNKKINNLIASVLLRYKFNFLLNDKIPSNSQLEKNFLIYKTIYNKKEPINFEDKYWKKIIQKNYKTYNEFINHK